MAIVRSKRKRHNFSIIDNSGLVDPKLSWKATGLLAFLMTKPDDWEIHIKSLSNNKTDKRDSTINALDELMKAGYVYRIHYRVKGKFDTNYIVFETPEDLEDWLKSDEGKEAIANGVEPPKRVTGTEKPERKNRNGKTDPEKPIRKNRSGKTDPEKPIRKNRHK